MRDAVGAPLPPRGGPAPGGGSPCALKSRPLHASEAIAFLTCPRKWAHAYLSRRVPVKTSEALSRGTQVHAWLAEWWRGNPQSEDLGTLQSLFAHPENGGVLPEDPIARACCVAYGAHYGKPPPGSWATEIPWTADVGGVSCAGTLDAEGVDPASGRTILVEHKTTSQDISPGSLYWREVVTTNLQVSMYRAAFPGAIILYDVIRKPALKKLRQGKPDEETDDEFVLRCVAAMSKEPEKYFQRAYVVRLEAEDEAFAQDIIAIDRLRQGGVYPRNPKSCFEYGSRCPYLGVCFGSESIDDNSLFRDQDPNR